MKNLLSICPSRGRPTQLRTMIKSFEATKSPGTDLVVYLNVDDPKLPEYEEVLAGREFVVGRRLYLVEAINRMWRACPDYPFYQVVNDDHVYITTQWDTKLIDIIRARGKGWGIACPNDLLTNWTLWKHPSAEVISANIPRALGYFIWPKIRHIGTDTVLGRLGMGIDRMWRDESIIIEHRHWSIGKSLLDENYKWVYGADEQGYGRMRVGEYLSHQLSLDIEKVKQAMGEEDV